MRGRGTALTSDEDDADCWGSAREAEGSAAPGSADEEGARRVRLEGCLPLGGLLKSVGRVGSRRALAGNAWFELLDGAGATMGSYFVNDEHRHRRRALRLRAPLSVDLTVSLWCENALAGAERVWDLIRARPAETALACGTSSPPRTDTRGCRWRCGPGSTAAGGRTDAPAGQVFALDGRHIVDRDSFYCAIGEAVNRPRRILRLEPPTPSTTA
ncbi:Barstar (barnase inhibitor) domain-containing protein OS=Streptomyces microflavus OX=1919 GN=Smic_66170 PE=3 SV=1 [Streptomyces microflavus]